MQYIGTLSGHGRVTPDSGPAPFMHSMCLSVVLPIRRHRLKDVPSLFAVLFCPARCYLHTAPLACGHLRVVQVK